LQALRSIQARSFAHELPSLQRMANASELIV
jgi:hypothetical protein